jgi:CBS domain-containing protein
MSQILKEIPVSEIMSIKRYLISPKMTVAKAYNLMRGQRISGVPVVQENKLVGIVTRADVKKVDRKKRNVTQVKDIMTKEPITIFQDEKVSTAFTKISESNIHGMPVLSRNGALVGYLTITDIRRALRTLKSRTMNEPKANNCPFCGGKLPLTLNRVGVCEHCGRTVRF